MESSPSPCKLDHGGLEPNAIAIYEEVMYRMLPLIHSSHFVCNYKGINYTVLPSCVGITIIKPSSMFL